MNDEQLLRYSRQIMLPQLDIAGQQSLLSAHVLVIGAGGLGSPVSLYLAAAGIGELTLIDDDDVELSNLQRQLAHAESAASSIRAINSEVRVQALKERAEGERLNALVAAADVVIDATDNFASRFAINKACLKAAVPLVSGAAIRFEGQVAVFDSRQTDSPCYECLYKSSEAQDQNCAENGVLAPVVGVIGSMQALEAIKLITGAGESLAGRLLLFDSLNAQWREMKLPRDPHCAACGAIEVPTA